MKRIGSEMLANLDQQLASGNINQHEYDSRRIEIEDMIRKGKDIDMDSTERTGRAIGGLAILIVCCAMGFFLIGTARVAVVGLVGGAAIVLGVVAGWSVAKPRAK
jgi:hypothetical protein